MAVLEELSTAAAQREMLPVHNPLTGEILAHVPVMTADDLRLAAERARAVQPAWEALGVRERARRMRQWADAMWRDRERLMRLIRRETGKTDGSAFAEIAIIDRTIDYYARIAPRVLRTRDRAATFPIIHRLQVRYVPYGVVGFLMPWNYPYMNLLIDLLPALMAGNACLLKPSELTPLVAQHVVERMHEAGIPEGAIQLVTGDGRTGAALVDVVDYIALTGSTATGRRVALRAAERLIPFTMELGGKDPLIVLDDADPDLAARSTLIGGLENAGQACVSVERVYVLDAIYDRFMERLLHHVGRLVCCADAGLHVDVGSMTHERELLRAEDHLRDALDKGAALVVGGQRRPDLGALFFEPTILTGVDHTMRVMREETFAPIVPVMRVRDEDEALRLANDSPYGLMGNIFTGNLRRGQALARRLQVGSVNINRAQIIFAYPSAPMAGCKQSGIGVRNGVEGLLRFVQPQSILTERWQVTAPRLNHTDPVSLLGYRVMRALRRVVPLI